jgi:hypothetical protein
VDPRYPVSGVALLPDTATTFSPTAQPPFRPAAITARITEWRPGAITIALTGKEAAPSHLLISENWYPDWRAEVDGRAGVVRRIDHTLLGVDLPPGSREVRLRFESSGYAKGKVISLIALLLAMGMILVTATRRHAVREMRVP